MTKEEWLQKCADRYFERGAGTKDQCMECAQTCLEAEIETNGDNPEKFDDPVDVADEDLSYWTDDGPDV